MDDLKKAYELLGLPENASREEVERAFEIVLRKSRSRQTDAEDANEAGESEYEQKLRAYKTIIGYEDRNKIEEASRQRFKKWGKFAGTAEKIDDFFRIYKTRVIIGVIAVIAVIVGITALVNYREEQKRLAALPPVDLSVMFVGNYASDENQGGDEGLEQFMTAQFPEWKRIELTLTYVPSQSESMTQVDMAYQQKAFALLATERPDVYILDQGTFDWLANSGVFENLDSLAASDLKPLLQEDNIIKGRAEEDTEDHVYGIKVTDSPMAKELPLFMQDMIITIRSGGENRDKALHFIERYLESEAAAQ
ncbi:molecular chaperone DnaJ [Paenibacillus sp. M1]|uniref:Molecular chaperone DnaJ n=1 Tax=Paenibacillus haidiansis TaxID=1574488 RepID=A0ABU7VQW7_9BACL